MSCLRGEVYWADVPIGLGSEQHGRRPVLVVQNDRGNRSAPTTVVAVLSSAESPRRYPFLVYLEAGEAGLPRPSHVNCAHLVTADQSRLGQRLGVLGPERMRQVAQALRYELDLQD